MANQVNAGKTVEERKKPFVPERKPDELPRPIPVFPEEPQEGDLLPDGVLVDPLSTRDRMVMLQAGVQDQNDPKEMMMFTLTWLMAKKGLSFVEAVIMLNDSREKRQALREEMIADFAAHPIYTDGSISAEKTRENVAWLGGLFSSAMKTVKKDGVFLSQKEFDDPKVINYTILYDDVRVATDYAWEFCRHSLRLSGQGTMIGNHNVNRIDAHEAFLAGYGSEETLKEDRKRAQETVTAGDRYFEKTAGRQVNYVNARAKRNGARIADVVNQIDHTHFPEVLNAPVVPQEVMNRDDWTVTYQDGMDFTKWTPEQLEETEKIFDRVFAPLLEEERLIHGEVTEEEFLTAFRMDRRSAYPTAVSTVQENRLDPKRTLQYAKAFVINRMVAGIVEVQEQVKGKAYGSYRMVDAGHYLAYRPLVRKDGKLEPSRDMYGFRNEFLKGGLIRLDQKEIYAGEVRNDQDTQKRAWEETEQKEFPKRREIWKKECEKKIDQAKRNRIRDEETRVKIQGKTAIREVNAAVDDYDWTQTSLKDLGVKAFFGEMNDEEFEKYGQKMGDTLKSTGIVVEDMDILRKWVVLYGLGVKGLSLDEMAAMNPGQKAALREEFFQEAVAHPILPGDQAPLSKEEKEKNVRWYASLLKNAAEKLLSDDAVIPDPSSVKDVPTMLKSLMSRNYLLGEMADGFVRAADGCRRDPEIRQIFDEAYGDTRLRDETCMKAVNRLAGPAVSIVNGEEYGNVMFRKLQMEQEGLKDLAGKKISDLRNPELMPYVEKLAVNAPDMQDRIDQSLGKYPNADGKLILQRSAEELKTYYPALYEKAQKTMESILMGREELVQKLHDELTAGARKEEARVEEPPKEEPKGEEPVKEEAPKEEPKAEEPVKEEAPKEEAPKQPVSWEKRDTFLELAGQNGWNTADNTAVNTERRMLRSAFTLYNNAKGWLKEGKDRAEAYQRFIDDLKPILEDIATGKVSNMLEKRAITDRLRLVYRRHRALYSSVGLKPAENRMKDWVTLVLNPWEQENGQVRGEDPVEKQIKAEREAREKAIRDLNQQIADAEKKSEKKQADDKPSENKPSENKPSENKQDGKAEEKPPVDQNAQAKKTESPAAAEYEALPYKTNKPFTAAAQTLGWDKNDVRMLKTALVALAGNSEDISGGITDKSYEEACRKFIAIIKEIGEKPVKTLEEKRAYGDRLAEVYDSITWPSRVRSLIDQAKKQLKAWVEANPTKAEEEEKKREEPFLPENIKPEFQKRAWNLERDDAVIDELLSIRRVLRADAVKHGRENEAERVNKSFNDILKVKISDERPISNRNDLIRNFLKTYPSPLINEQRAKLQDILAHSAAREKLENEKSFINSFRNYRDDEEMRKILGDLYRSCANPDGTWNQYLEDALRQNKGVSLDQDRNRRNVLDSYVKAVKEYERLVQAGSREAYIDLKMKEEDLGYGDVLIPLEPSRQQREKAEQLAQQIAGIDARFEAEAREEEKFKEFFQALTDKKWHFDEEDTRILYNAGSGLPEDHPYHQLMRKFLDGDTGNYDPAVLGSYEDLHIPARNDILRQIPDALKDVPESPAKRAVLEFVEENARSEEALREEQEKKDRMPVFLRMRAITQEQADMFDPVYKKIGVTQTEQMAAVVDAMRELRKYGNGANTGLYYQRDYCDAVIQGEQAITAAIDANCPELQGRYNTLADDLLKVLEALNPETAQAYREKVANLHALGSQVEPKQPVQNNAQGVNRPQNGQPDPQGGQVNEAQNIEDYRRAFIEGNADQHLEEADPMPGDSLRDLLAESDQGLEPDRQSFRKLDQWVNENGGRLTNRRLEQLCSHDQNTRFKAIQAMFKECGLEAPERSELEQFVGNDRMERTLKILPNLGDYRKVHVRMEAYLDGLTRTMTMQKQAAEHVDTWNRLSGSDRRKAVNEERQWRALQEAEPIREAGAPYNTLTEGQKQLLDSLEELESVAAIFETKKHMRIVNWNSSQYNEAKEALDALRTQRDAMRRYIVAHRNDGDFADGFAQQKALLDEKEERLRTKLETYINKVSAGGTKNAEDMTQDAGTARLVGARELMNLLKRDIAVNAVNAINNAPAGEPQAAEHPAAENGQVHDVSFAQLYKTIYKDLKQEGASNVHRRAASSARSQAQAQQANGQQVNGQQPNGHQANGLNA